MGKGLDQTVAIGVRDSGARSTASLPSSHSSQTLRSTSTLASLIVDTAQT